MTTSLPLMIAKDLGSRIELMSEAQYARLLRAKNSAERKLLSFSHQTVASGYIEFISVGITLWIMLPKNNSPGYIFDLEIHDPDRPPPTEQTVRIFDSFLWEDGELVCENEPELIYRIQSQRLAEGELLHVF